MDGPVQKSGLSWWTARRRLITVVIIAVAAVAMVLGAGNRAVQIYDGLAKADRMAAISMVLSGTSKAALPVTLLDVDDATRQSWRSTGDTPHAALALLIEMAAGHGGRAILVDFDLSAQSPGSLADPRLSSVLRTYPDSAPPLLLVRRIIFRRSADDATLSAAGAVPSPYDADVAGKDNIVWVTTLNDSEPGRAVRRIRLWQVVCDGASGSAFPSAALAMAAISRPDGAGPEALKAFLDGLVVRDCQRVAPPPPSWPPVQDQAVALPYVFGNATTSPALMRMGSAGRDTVVFRRISAGQLVSHENGEARALGEIDRDPFDGRAVILGASYASSNDYYETPLGTMPGCVILANSLVQARAIVETRPLPAVFRAAPAIGLFLVFIVLVRRLVAVAALLSMLLVSLVALTGFSRIFGFASGMDIVTTALSGFALYKLMDMLVALVIAFRAQGWRALFKPRTKEG
ncbi:MAG: CHASE2 domain-containing protein [Alphaproteobacteria bacterium]|nr:CHASE2 domain-containing protein [Alphaproteobacteria bacterium]